MSFDWCDFLDLAFELESKGKKEADFRSAISRAYYASYCSARNHLRDNENDPCFQNQKICQKTEKKSIHWILIEKYKNHSNPHRQDIGHDLERLFDDRKKADYEDVIHNNNIKRIKNLAAMSIFLANNVKKNLTKI